MAKKRVMTAVFNVTVTLPPGCNLKDMNDYVREAVKVHCATTDPDGPVFAIDPVTVKVSLLRTTTEYA